MNKIAIVTRIIEMSSWGLIQSDRAIEISAIILARRTEVSIDWPFQLVAKLQTCTLFSTTSTYMCRCSSFRSEVSGCKARGRGTALADPATTGPMSAVGYGTREASTARYNLRCPIFQYFMAV